MGETSQEHASKVRVLDYCDQDPWDQAVSSTLRSIQILSVCVLSDTRGDFPDECSVSIVCAWDTVFLHHRCIAWIQYSTKNEETLARLIHKKKHRTLQSNRGRAKQKVNKAQRMLPQHDKCALKIMKPERKSDSRLEGVYLPSRRRRIVLRMADAVGVLTNNKKDIQQNTNVVKRTS